MQNPGSMTFLALFAVTTLLVYLAVRRGWLSVRVSAIVDAAASSLFFGLYALSEGKDVPQSIITGLFLGLLFTGMTVASAAFFKNNEAAQSSASQSSLEPPSTPNA